MRYTFIRHLYMLTVILSTEMLEWVNPLLKFHETQIGSIYQMFLIAILLIFLKSTDNAAHTIILWFAWSV